MSGALAPGAQPALRRESWYRWAAIACVLVGTLRIVATYDDLSETVDEVAHLGAGMEWLVEGRYTYEPKHAPLARVAIAVGPYLLGVRVHDAPTLLVAGRRALYADGRYLRNLTAARLGILPFFAIAALFVWRVGREAFGADVALGAVACFTLLPPVLAHFGVATTDGPFEAMFAATLYAMLMWLKRPTLRRGAWLGAAAGLALASKFSALPYLGITITLALGARLWSMRVERRGGRMPGSVGDSAQPPVATSDPIDWSWRSVFASLAMAAVAAFFVTWAAYRFSVGTLRGIPLPAPELVRGIRDLAAHNREGNPSYFLGQFRMTGVWYFFPVLLLIKTPLSALVLGVAGLAMLARRAWRDADWVAAMPIAVTIAILAVAIPSRINIGVRHVLPIYIAIALGAAVAWQYAWRRFRGGRRATLVAATALLSAGTVTIHPDYLAYFNVLAGRDPSRIVADSDLDWGQDLFRLARVAREQHIDTLRFAHIGSGDLSPIIGVPLIQWDGRGRPTGWVAMSETLYRVGRITVRNGVYQRDGNSTAWMDSAAKFIRVGRGIRLYHFPPPNATGLPRTVRP